MKTISLIVACYNEQDNIELLHARVKDLFARMPAYSYELIFVDNVSTDNTRDKIQACIKQDPWVKALFVARNTGNSQPSYWAGLKYCTGDAAVLLDGDLQDPPEVIEHFVEQWEQGAQVVYGVRVKRNDALLLRICYRLFYRLFRALSYLDIPLDAGDFGLMDRSVVDVITQLPEKDIYIRGMRAWVGFRQVGVNYIRQARHSGFSTNRFFGNLYWVKKAIVNFSHRPLEYIALLAALTTCGTCLFGIFYIYKYFTCGAPAGFLTLLLSVLMVGSINLLALSVIAEYILRIFDEVKNRPPYVIQSVVTHATLKKDEQL